MSIHQSAGIEVLTVLTTIDRIDPMPALIVDLLQSIRSFSRSPVLTATVLLILSVGTGTSIVVFSIIDSLLVKTLSYPEPQRTVQIMGSSRFGPFEIANVPRLVWWRAQHSIFEEVAGYDFAGAGIALTDGDRPENLSAKRVSREYFHIFDARFLTGRSFTAEEEQPGGPRAAVISASLWRHRYGSDPFITGRTISLGWDPYLVVGVVELEPLSDETVDIWLPLRADVNSRDIAYFLKVVGRLKRGITLDQARAALGASVPEYRKLFPDDMGEFGGMTAELLTRHESAKVRPTVLIFSLAALCILIGACANVSNLLAARNSARNAEFAVRLALGAGTRRIVALAVGEGILLSFAGTLAGLAFAWIILRAVVPLYPGSLHLVGNTSTLAMMNWHIVWFSLLLAVFTGVLCSLIPALRASRHDVSSVLKSSDLRGSGRHGNRSIAVMVTIEVALAMILLTSASVLVRSFAALRAVDPGFDSQNVISMQMPLTGSRLDRVQDIVRIVNQTEPRIEALPGIMGAAVVTSLPLEPSITMAVNIEGRPAADRPYHALAAWRYVTPRYFDILRIPVIRGRTFTQQDRDSAPRVILINQTMAKAVWGADDPIGQRLILHGGGPDSQLAPAEIVGIVGDVRDIALNEAPGNIVYVPLTQVQDAFLAKVRSWYPLTWVVRTKGEMVDSSVIESIILETARLPVKKVRSMRQVVADASATNRFQSVLLSCFAVIAVGLAAAGSYSVIVFSVQRRRADLSIRLALGATAFRLKMIVARQVMTFTVIGIVLGSAGGWVLARLGSSSLYGVRAVDSHSIMYSSMVVLTVTAVAMILAFRIVPSGKVVNLKP